MNASEERIFNRDDAKVTSPLLNPFENLIECFDRDFFNGSQEEAVGCLLAECAILSLKGNGRNVHIQ